MVRQKVKEYAETRSTAISDWEKEVYLLKDKVDNLKSQETKYAQMYAEGLLEVEQLRSLIKQSRSKKEYINSKIKELEKKKPVSSSVTDAEIELLCNEAQKIIQSQDFADKKLVLKNLVSKIIIKKGGAVETWLNISLNTQYLEHGTERRNSRITKCR